MRRAGVAAGGCVDPANRGGGHRARAGVACRIGAAHARNEGAGGDRQQRQDQCEGTDVRDPGSGRRRAGHARPRLHHAGQPQQRDWPAAGGAGCAGRCAVRHLRNGRRQAGRHRVSHRHRPSGCGAGEQYRPGAYRAPGQPAWHCRHQGRDLRRPAGRRRGRDQCRRCVRALFRTTCSRGTRPRSSPDPLRAGRECRRDRARCRAGCRRLALRAGCTAGRSADHAGDAGAPQCPQRTGGGIVGAGRRHQAGGDCSRPQRRPPGRRSPQHASPCRRRDADRRQLQRQPRVTQRRDRHAGDRRRRTLAGAGRHARAR